MTGTGKREPQDEHASLHFFATAARGTADLLAGELRAIGAIAVHERSAGCDFEGDLGTAYRACLWSRVAHRVLLELARYPVGDADDLYAQATSLAWEQFIDPGQTIAVDFNPAHGAPVAHGVYGAQRIKDAVVDRLRERTGERPSVSLDAPDVRVFVHLSAARAHVPAEARVSIDFAGASLHQRGYRAAAGEAPLRETLAAALLMRSGWPEIAAAGGAFCDPMCGAGTLVIEAALMAAGIAPGLLREDFAFTRWRGHDETLWRHLHGEAKRQAKTASGDLPAIIGSDTDPRAVALARANATRAGIAGLVGFEQRAVADAAPPGGGPGLLLTNPPYGGRMGADDELAPLYAALGQVLVTRFGGWRAALLTGDPGLGRHVGLRAVRRHTFWNGAIECRLLRFEPGAPKPGPGAADDAAAAVAGHAPHHVDTGEFANRLRKNLRRLGRWAVKERIDCYRLYDADLPEFAVAVDLYTTTAGRRLAHVQEYAPPASIDATLARRRLQAALATLREVLSLGREHVSVKRRERQRGARQYQRLDARGRFQEVYEGGCRLLVNLDDYVDTGLFLDHRPTRELLRGRAGGRRFLNLFCYTAAATVHAAAGGAVASTSVDLSSTYLSWAARNFERNDMDTRVHSLVRAECMDWLRQAAREGARYDLIFVDPPTFSNSRRMRGTFDIQRDHTTLLRRCLAVLADGGELVFSCNRRDFHLQQDELTGLVIENLSRATLPVDFARNPRIHQCWRLTPA